MSWFSCTKLLFGSVNFVNSSHHKRSGLTRVSPSSSTSYSSSPLIKVAAKSSISVISYFPSLLFWPLYRSFWNDSSKMRNALGPPSSTSKVCMCLNRVLFPSPVLSALLLLFAFVVISRIFCRESLNSLKKLLCGLSRIDLIFANSSSMMSASSFVNKPLLRPSDTASDHSLNDLNKSSLLTLRYRQSRLPLSISCLNKSSSLVTGLATYSRPFSSRINDSSVISIGRFPDSSASWATLSLPDLSRLDTYSLISSIISFCTFSGMFCHSSSEVAS